MTGRKFAFYEFFAGGGMARIGLGSRWQCQFANDICEKKAQAYRNNFEGAPELVVRDIRTITTREVPGEPLLAWASFPCQDLSLAGNGEGLNGERSGTFWAFWTLIEGLAKNGRAAPIVVLENVVGAITSNNGRDFQAIIEAIADQGYRVGALVIDAVHFVPQSRPRLFILAVDSGWNIPDELKADSACDIWHPKALRAALSGFSASLRERWVWWHLPIPNSRGMTLSELIERNPSGVTWHTKEETQRLLGMMSKANIRKVEKASRLGSRVIGTIYRRTRLNEDGKRVQRAEVRFDQISGCLRTPVGGSSRQTILVVNGDSIRSRLLSPREAARLMGAPETYALPENYNEAYHLMGDGLVIPVVSWLEAHLLFPIAQSKMRASEAA
jgi:DNA (cytosine-5)-methyltransferase 1